MRTAIATGVGHARYPLTLSMSLLCSSDDSRGSGIIVGMVEERLDVRLEERIKGFGDSILFSELFSSCERNPDAFEMHSSNFDDDSLLFILEDTITLSTGHATYVEQLGTVNHVVVMSSGDADTTSVHLEAKGAFVFPEGGSNSVSASKRELCRVLRR